MSEEKKRTLKDHLIERIKKSGFPLEIEISNLLDKEFVVFNTQYYFDEELKQGRDIDIYAIPNAILETYTNEELEKRIAPFSLMTEIAVECKKSETHAWVFFTRPLLPPTSLHFSGQYCDESSKAMSVESLLFGKSVFHYDEFNEAAIASYEIKIEKEKKNRSRRTIFEGVNQLVKFILHEKGPPIEPKTAKGDFNIRILFPIIVFDGYMYRVNLEFGEPKLEKIEHILVKTNHRSPYTKEVESFLIDIVHRSYFSKFMRKLNQDFQNLIDLILKNHDELVKKVEETRQKYKAKPKKGTFA